MKTKLSLIIAPIVAIIYLSFISYPIITSLMKMLAAHKGDPEIGDAARYFVIAQYTCMAFFPPVICLIAFIREAIKTRKDSSQTNSGNRKSMEENPYAPPAIEPSRFLKDLPRDERRRLILEGKTTAGPLAVFTYEHPVWSMIIGIAAVSAFFFGCWTCIQI